MSVMTDTELSELKTVIEQRMEELDSSLAYLTEETRPIEPSVSLGRLRLVPETLLCVPCAEKKPGFSFVDLGISHLQSG